MLRFAADENSTSYISVGLVWNLNNIVRGLTRRKPDVDIEHSPPEITPPTSDMYATEVSADFISTVRLKNRSNRSGRIESSCWYSPDTDRR